MASGVFDRFPKLQMVFGHLGEGLPFWMFRLDFMHRAQVSTQRYECLKPLKRKISDYMRENVYYTTSGMAWEPAVMFTRSVVGTIDDAFVLVRHHSRKSQVLPIPSHFPSCV